MTLTSHKQHWEDGCDPTLRDSFQRCNVASGKVQAYRAAQESSRLLGREVQVGGVQLGRLVSDAKPGKRQGRRSTRPDITRCVLSGTCSNMKETIRWTLSESITW